MAKLQFILAQMRDFYPAKFLSIYSLSSNFSLDFL